jgi:hypothetical protein
MGPSFQIRPLINMVHPPGLILGSGLLKNASREMLLDLLVPRNGKLALLR